MKKIIICIFLILPISIDALCSNEIRDKGKELAEKITTEISYNESRNTYTFTLYNVDNDMKIYYSNHTYKPNNAIVSLSNISEGTNVTVDIYYTDSCDEQVHIIKKTMPYYNRYFESLICDGYEDKLYACSTKFTSYYITEEIVKLAINNYDTQQIPIDVEVPIEEKPQPTIIDKAKDVINEWGYKVALAVCSSLITIIIGNSMYRKEVHGV